MFTNWISVLCWLLDCSFSLIPILSICHISERKHLKDFKTAKGETIKYQARILIFDIWGKGLWYTSYPLISRKLDLVLKMPHTLRSLHSNCDAWLKYFESIHGVASHWHCQSLCVSLSDSPSAVFTNVLGAFIDVFSIIILTSLVLCSQTVSLMLCLQNHRKQFFCNLNEVMWSMQWSWMHFWQLIKLQKQVCCTFLINCSLFCTHFLWSHLILFVDNVVKLQPNELLRMCLKCRETFMEDDLLLHLWTQQSGFGSQNST